MTLTEALAAYGVTNIADEMSHNDSRQVLYYGDFCLGRFNVVEGWDYYQNVILAFYTNQT